MVHRGVVLLLAAHDVSDHEARVSVGRVHAQQRRALCLARVLRKKWGFGYGNMG